MKVSRRELLKTASIAGAGVTAAAISAPLVDNGRARAEFAGHTRRIAPCLR